VLELDEGARDLPLAAAPGVALDRPLEEGLEPARQRLDQGLERTIAFFRELLGAPSA